MLIGGFKPHKMINNIYYYEECLKSHVSEINLWRRANESEEFLTTSEFSLLEILKNSPVLNN